MNNKLALTTFGIYIALASILYFIISAFTQVPMRASVYPRVISVNEEIFFADSTSDANSTLWEFGNGSKSSRRKGSYKFKVPGRYIVRVTVNNEKNDTFMVTVNKPALVYKRDSTVYVYANKSGIVNQKIHFRAMGGNIEWCEWYFGESGKIDARGHEAFYAFNKVGEFSVKLITNLNPQKPVTYEVSISPEYKVTENVVPVPKAAPKGGGGGGGETDEFKSRLQALANGANFSVHYNFLVNKFLCNNSKVPVLVNGKTTSDFYSYCQGLQINSGVKIDQVTPEINPKTNCASKIIIVQH